MHDPSSDRSDPIEKPLRLKRKSRYPITAPLRVRPRAATVQIDTEVDSSGPTTSQSTRIPRLVDAPDEPDPFETNIPPSPPSRGPPADRSSSHHFLYHSHYFFSKSNRKE